MNYFENTPEPQAPVLPANVQAFIGDLTDRDHLEGTKPVLLQMPAKFYEFCKAQAALHGVSARKFILAHTFLGFDALIQQDNTEIWKRILSDKATGPKANRNRPKFINFKNDYERPLGTDPKDFGGQPNVLLPPYSSLGMDRYPDGKFDITHYPEEWFTYNDYLLCDEVGKYSETVVLHEGNLILNAPSALEMYILTQEDLDKALSLELRDDIRAAVAHYLREKGLTE